MKLSPSFPSININKKGKIISLETWHIINGKWVHIFQDYTANKFYTNGVKEKNKK